MTDAVDTLRIGPVAADILQHDGEAEVAAVFERSIYVAAPRGYVCIGTETIGDGPINVLVQARDGTLDWSRLGVTREAKGAVTGGTLHLGETYALRFGGAPVWQPPVWQTTSRVQLEQASPALRSAARPLCPAEGLSRLVFDKAERGDRTAQAAAPIVASLRDALTACLTAQHCNADLGRAATLLLGLGPGLTPSGDDMLGGVFLVLSALGQTVLRDALWESLEDELELLTVGISAAHLAAAADGLGAASVHAATNALLAGDVAAFPGHLEALGRIGHSSGFDTLAGIVLAAEAALAAGLP